MARVGITIGDVELELRGEAALIGLAERQYAGFLADVDDPWRVRAVIDDAPLAYPDRLILQLDRSQTPWLIRSRHFAAELDPQKKTAIIHYRVNPNQAADHVPGALHFALRAIVSTITITTGGLALHASGVALEGAGLAFFGPSEAGKTTIAYQLEAAAGVTLLADDVVITTTGPGGPLLHSTPFSGRNQPIHPRRRASAPFRHGFLLRQATMGIGLEPANRAEAFRTFMRAPLAPRDDGQLEEQTLRQAEQLFGALAWHTVAFDLDARSTAAALHGLK